MALCRISRLTSRCLSSVMASSQRTFLSDQFDLRVRMVANVNAEKLHASFFQPEWNERLKAPLFSKIEMDKYFIDIDRQYFKMGVISHVDLDIFANALLLSRDRGTISSETDIESRCEQVEELLRRFNSTPEAIKMLPSTPHAIIRACVDVKETEFLLNLLNNRLKFGVIMDDFTNTFLANYFIKNENFRDASKVGILMMLQEEHQVPIASEMSLWSVYKYIQQLKSEGLPPWDPRPVFVEPEPEEEVKIRVKEVENPYFDGHFDLTKKEHLLGKTLAKVAICHGENIVAESLKLLGFTMLEKWDKVSQILDSNCEFAEECVEEAKKYASSSQNSEIENKLSSAKSTKINVEQKLEDKIKKSVQVNESKYIESQIAAYKKWNIVREEELQLHYKKAQQSAKLQEFDQHKVKIEEEEERLFFFDNYEQMEQGKRTKFAEWRKTWPRRTWAPQIKFGWRDPNVPLVTRRDRQAAKQKLAAKK